MPTAIADKEPTFDLPSGSASDFFFSREINDRDSENNGKIVKKHGIWNYPFLTRRTGDSLVGTNEELTSSEFKHGRTKGKNKLGNASSSGSLDFELSPETFDDQLEGVFRDRWIRFLQDGQSNGIAKDFITPKGYIHVNGDPGTYNQWYDDSLQDMRVTEVPLLYTGAEAGTKAEPFGLIKVGADKLPNRAIAPFGKFIAHELHVGNTPVKYSATSRIPITDSTVRYQNYNHVELGELNLSVTVNSIVTGSFSMNGANNPDYYTENQEAGKTRMADFMTNNKSVAVGTGEEFFSNSYRDAAEGFLAAAKSTTKSTETDQFTALDGFLYVNGHQLQFASDLTLALNNNLTPINAIFVKNAIANLSPSLDVSGNITAYFTDGEKDATGVKYGADDLKNLASKNKDVEIVFAFIDKEDPDVVYLFQIFSASITAPTETKDASNPISLSLPYNSYGEMAVRCIRLAIPKVRLIDLDMDSVVKAIRKGTSSGKDEVPVKVYMSVPLDKDSVSTGVAGEYKDGDYVDALNRNGLYVFNGAKVYVIDQNGASHEDTDAIFSDAMIASDGTINAKLTLSNDLVEGEHVKIVLTVNGETHEDAETVEINLPYLRMGENFRNAMYAKSSLSLKPGEALAVFTAKVEGGSDAEDDLLYKVDTDMTADDIVLSSDDSILTIKDGAVTVKEGTANGETAKLKIASKADASVYMVLNIKAKVADTPVFASTLADASYTVGDSASSLNGTATVSDGGTVSYVWKVNGSNVATTAAYKPDTTAAGTQNIEVVATNTLPNGATATATQSCVITVASGN